MSSYTITFLPNQQILHVKFSGIFQPSLSLEALNQVFEHPDYPKVHCLLWDILDVQLQLKSKDDIKELADFANNLQGRLTHSKAAVVTKEDLVFGLTRMYGALREDNHVVSFHVFRSVEEAKFWFSESQASIQ